MCLSATLRSEVNVRVRGRWPVPLALALLVSIDRRAAVHDTSIGAAPAATQTRRTSTLGCPDGRDYAPGSTVIAPYTHILYYPRRPVSCGASMRGGTVAIDVRLCPTISHTDDTRVRASRAAGTAAYSRYG